MLLISMLLDTAIESPDEVLGELPGAGGVRTVLSDLQASAPDAFDDLVLHCQVGAAAAYCLRRHRGGASSDLPLWVDFGSVIHALGLVAAARGGRSWSTRIPARDGHVMLPTLGMARLSSGATTVEASTTAGVIRLLDGDREIVVDPQRLADSDHWWTLRRLGAGDGAGLSVWLDDLDPFRDLADPVPPSRLDDEAFARWSALLADAWSLLCRDHPREAEAMADGVISLVPLLPVPGWDTRSASNGEAFGSVMVSEPPDAVTLAVALVHEYQHIVLGGLIHLLRLTEDDDGALYYAPWRDDPRPLPGLLQGVYAFLGIAAFWRRHRHTVDEADTVLADMEYAYARTQTADAARIVRDAPTLTPAGRRFVEGILAELATWASDEISEEALRLAALNLDSHRAGWRLRHHVPDADEVSLLARAWAAGADPSGAPSSRIQPHPDIRWRQRIPALTRLRALGRDLPSGTPPRGQDPLFRAENALVDGKTVDAAASYLRAIEETRAGSDDDVRAWAGLVLTGAAGEPDADRVWRDRPEVVRALHTALRGLGYSSSPFDLARWLAPVGAAAD